MNTDQKKANILVQYQGGGYDGCIWEYNFCLVDDVDNPTVFQDIFSSGYAGVKTLNEYKHMDSRDRSYHFDLTSEEDWKSFDRETNPGLVVGVSSWLWQHREDIAHSPFCDECGCTLDVDDDCCLGDFHGAGGIVIEAGSKKCSSCAESSAWEGYLRGNLVSDLEKEGVDLDEYSEEEIDKILHYAIDHVCACIECQGDEYGIYRYDEVVAAMVDNGRFLIKEALRQDKQLELV